MKLYKLRVLTTCNDLSRIKQIIKTEQFWCSKFHEMNDPMEGVYYASNIKLIEQIYNDKESYKICSFSGEEGFLNPAMWGYYAGGFKGVAMEVEVYENKVFKIDYVSKVKKSTNAIKILTTKLNFWKHEDEYRYLKQTNKNLNAIGKITKIYTDYPYNNINNESRVLEANKTLQKYRELKSELESFLRNESVEFVEVCVKNNTVAVI